MKATRPSRPTSDEQCRVFKRVGEGESGWEIAGTGGRAVIISFQLKCHISI